MLVEILLFIVIAMLVSYLVLFYRKKSPVFKGEKAYYDLSTSNQLVLPNDKLPWTNKPCALRFGIYIEAAPKTLSKVDCVSLTPSTDAVVFKPSCSNYEFTMCKCDGLNCVPCENNSSYMNKLLSIGNVFELWASGYTSENDKPLVPALLRIVTAKDPRQRFVESVSLPAIPLQKWTIITIVKEGRRFDVYYGSVNVASKLLEHIPVPPDSGNQWLAGHPRWRGKIGFFNGKDSTPTAQEIDKDVRSLVNSRGVPFFMDSFETPEVKIPKCPFGNCDKLPEIRPPSQFVTFA